MSDSADYCIASITGHVESASNRRMSVSDYLTTAILYSFSRVEQTRYQNSEYCLAYQPTYNQC